MKRCIVPGSHPRQAGSSISYHDSLTFHCLRPRRRIGSSRTSTPRTTLYCQQLRKAFRLLRVFLFLEGIPFRFLPTNKQIEAGVLLSACLTSCRLRPSACPCGKVKPQYQVTIYGPCRHCGHNIGLRKSSRRSNSKSFVFKTRPDCSPFSPQVEVMDKLLNVDLCLSCLLCFWIKDCCVEHRGEQTLRWPGQYASYLSVGPSVVAFFTC